jgi:hypothetical protein
MQRTNNMFGTTLSPKFPKRHWTRAATPPGEEA